MKILVTGGNGQLGNEIRQLADDHKKHTFVFTDLPELDLTDEIALKGFIADVRPDAIVNAAAYTAVDLAEKYPEQAKAVNCDAVRYLSKCCTGRDVPLIHVSTDYVFNGKYHRPYTESDTASPVSVYGSTKRMGEREVAHHAKKAMIIRTSWLYSSFGNNFVKTMLRLGKENKEIRVVADQAGCPTYAGGLAEAVIRIIPECSKLKETEIFHYADAGIASWYDFAVGIFEIAGMKVRVVPITTKEYPTPAERPFYSVLDTSKIRLRFKLQIPHWRDHLRTCMKRMKAQGIY